MYIIGCRMLVGLSSFFVHKKMWHKPHLVVHFGLIHNEIWPIGHHYHKRLKLWNFTQENNVSILASIPNSHTALDHWFFNSQTGFVLQDLSIQQCYYSHSYAFFCFDKSASQQSAKRATRSWQNIHEMLSVETNIYTHNIFIPHYPTSKNRPTP